MRGEPCSVRRHQDCSFGPECCENGTYTAGDDGGCSFSGFGRIRFQFVSSGDVGKTGGGGEFCELFRVRLEEVRLSCGIAHQAAASGAPPDESMAMLGGGRTVRVRPESTSDGGVEIRRHSWWE